MPLVPVPRWQPFRSYKVTNYYLDALRNEWTQPSFGADAVRAEPTGFSFFTPDAASYQQYCLTAREQQARCQISWGPADSVGIWQPVARAQWQQLDPARLHLVQAHRRNDSHPDPAYSPATLAPWQHPGWYEVATAPVYQTQRETVRFEWNTSTDVLEHTIVRPARTLEQLFTSQHVAFDMREVPTSLLTSSAALLPASAGSCDSQGYPPGAGPLSEAVGKPAPNQTTAVELLTNQGAVCFACDPRDIHAVWVHVRNGPAHPLGSPTDAVSWEALDQLLAELTAQGR